MIMKSRNFSKLAVLLVGALVLASAGCVATRKFVRNTVSPLDKHINNVDQKVDQKTAENQQQIRDLDKKTESGIAQAQSSAEQANQSANTADQHAQAANQVAEKGLSTANVAKEMVNNIDNYHPSQRAIVLFGLNKSILTSEDKQHLDELADATKDLKHYVIQIQGYTDTTGPKPFNLQLSERRANAVVRYLTLNHNIPLVKIYKLGYGEASPTASNATRKGRELNRRVEVTVMVPQLPGQEGSTQAESTQPNQ
jgi:OmpA-OmpF porin, OOP family